LTFSARGPADHFFAVNPDIISIPTVGERLANGQYETPDAAYDDIHPVLEPFIAFFQADLRLTRAKLSGDW
jgi:hypothetical protein